MEATLSQGYIASPYYTYEKLMDSTTTIQPLRSSYVTTRMVNNVEGVSMRRHWKEVD